MTDQLRAAAQAALEWFDYRYPESRNAQSALAVSEPLRTALAADAEQCEWSDSGSGFFKTQCGERMLQREIITTTKVKFCFNCGKRIKFRESEE